MYRGKVTAVDASGVYVQTAEYGTLGPCQAVVANYTAGDMVLCVNVGDDTSPELVVVGRLSATGSATAGSTADNAVPRFDGTGGALQTSGIVVDDNDRLRVASGSSGGLEIGASGTLALSGTGGPSGIAAPVGSTWRQTDTNSTHGSLTGLLWNKVGTGTAEGADWLVDYEGRWVAYTPTWTNVSMSSTDARYTITGDMCHLSIRGVLSGAPSGTVTVTLPSVASMRYAEQIGPARLVRSSSYNGVWRRDSGSATTIRIGYWNSSNVFANLSATAPASWASGDRITLSATYEINV